MSAALHADLRAGGERRRVAVGLLFDGLAPKMLRHFERHRLSREEAEDALQDTFACMLRGLDGFRGDSGSPAAFDAWIWAIARNALTDTLRRRHPGMSLDQLADDDALDALLASIAPDTPDPAQAGGLAGCVRAAFAAFEAAHPARAAAMRLVHLEEWDGAEMAAYLRRSPGAAREYLSQCRTKLRPFLERCREWLEP